MKDAAGRAPGGWVAAATLLAAATGPALEPQRWWPALLVLTVGVVLLARHGPAELPPGRAPRVALVAAAAWALLSTASIAWAQDPAWAWEAAGRAWLVAGTLAVVLLWPGHAPRHERIRGAASAVAAAAALEAVIAWAGALTGTPLADGRLRGALPYANGLALVMVAGALAALGLAAAARTAAGRGGGAALAGALLATGLAAQSRSSLPVLVTGLLVAAACGGLAGRTRRAGLVACAAAAATVLVAAGPVLAIRRQALAHGDVPAQAAGALLLLLLAAALAGLVAALATRGGEAADGTTGGTPIRAGRALLGAAAVAVALAPVVVTIAARDHVDYRRVESASTRFSAGAASNRPDLWRVAWLTLRHHPAGGVGAGSFERPYLRLRHAGVAPRFAHSLPAEAAATLGVPGLLLVLAGVGALGLAAVRGADPGAHDRSAVAPWLAGAGAAIAAHALVDWTTELPVVALLAIVTLGTLAAAPGGDRAGADAAAAPVRTARAPSRALAVALAVATLAMLPVAAAATLAQRRGVGDGSDVERRLDELALAARLSPLDARPLESRALVALRHDRPAAARRAVTEALHRDRDGWFALWMAGVLAEPGSPRRDALLREAARQNPREAVVLLATSGAADGRPLDLDRALAALVPEG